MKKLINIVALALLVIVSACGDEKSSPEVIQYKGNLEGLFTESRINGVSLFYDAMVKTGLDSKLSDGTARTFFAPNDAAMQAALQQGGFLTVQAASDSFLTAVINNHIVAGSVLSTALTKTSVTNDAGNPIFISVADGVVLNAQATVTDADNTASNGVVHVIDFPLLNFASQSIREIVTASANDATSPEFTVLDAALTRADITLDDTLYTVFAPTDAAFVTAFGAADAAAAIAEVNATSVEDVTNLLLDHVLADRFFTVDGLASGRLYFSRGGAGTAQGFDVTIDEASVAIETSLGTAESAAVNVMATNGTVHIIDGVLIAEEYVDDLVSTLGASAFYTALTTSAFNYDSLLSTEEEYTVLAPEATVYTGGNSKAELDAYIFAGSMPFEVGVMTSIGGQRYYVYENLSGFFRYNNRTSAIVRSTDNEGYNGLVTTIRAELTPLPTTGTSTQAIATAGADSLELFFGSLAAAGLDSLIDVTYFAVGNDQMEPYVRAAITAGGEVNVSGIAAGDYEMLIDSLAKGDLEDLTVILQHHIVPELVFAATVEVGNEYTDNAGGTLTVVSVDGSVGFLSTDDGTISLSALTGADILGANGIVHVVSEPILEQ